MTSIFSAEFISLKKAVEEVVTCRYYCRASGIRVLEPTVIYKDNTSMVLNISNLEINLQYKLMTLSYHFCREHMAGGVVEVGYVKSKENISDSLTKGLDSTNFYNYFMLSMSN